MGQFRRFSTNVLVGRFWVLFVVGAGAAAVCGAVGALVLRVVAVLLSG